MTYDSMTDPRLLDTPLDEDLPTRTARLNELGLGHQPVRAFDEFAARLAEAAGTPYAMVNFIREDQQYFAGLFVPADKAGAIEAAQAVSHATPGRTMPRDYGWCPHVAARKKAMVLDDVCEYPRFIGNPVVNRIGIRSYLGAPLLDKPSGVALGTICAVATTESTWGREGLAMIKSMAEEVMRMIERGDAHR